jgi:hypothetical protein
MRFDLLPQKEQIERYAQERRRTFELRRHLNNTTRMLVLERGWLRVAWKSAADARQELYDERKKQQCTLPTPHTKPQFVVVAFILGVMVGLLIWRIHGA